MAKQIVGVILTAEQRRKGFSLDESDDHTLRLLYHSKPAASFSSTGVTVAEIRATADRIAKQTE